MIAYYRTTRKMFGARLPGTRECLPEESPAYTSHPVTSSLEFFSAANGGHVSILLSFHRRLFTPFLPLVAKKCSRSDFLLFIRYQCVKFIPYLDYFSDIRISTNSSESIPIYFPIYFLCYATVARFLWS